MIVGFGLCFEVPLFLVILNLARVVTHERFRKWRRLIIFLVFVFAGIASPSPDPLTMLLLGGVVVVLVEVAEILIYFNDKRYARNHPDLYADLADDELAPIEDPSRSTPTAQARPPDRPDAVPGASRVPGVGEVPYSWWHEHTGGEPCRQVREVPGTAGRP